MRWINTCHSAVITALAPLRFGVEAPAEINTQRLAWRAAHSRCAHRTSVNHFLEEHAHKISSLRFQRYSPEAIKPGIIKLAEALKKR